MLLPFKIEPYNNNRLRCIFNTFPFAKRGHLRKLQFTTRSRAACSYVCNSSNMLGFHPNPEHMLQWMRNNGVISNGSAQTHIGRRKKWEDFFWSDEELAYEWDDGWNSPAPTAGLSEACCFVCQSKNPSHKLYLTCHHDKEGNSSDWVHTPCLAFAIATTDKPQTKALRKYGDPQWKWSCDICNADLSEETKRACRAWPRNVVYGPAFQDILRKHKDEKIFKDAYKHLECQWKEEQAEHERRDPSLAIQRDRLAVPLGGAAAHDQTLLPSNTPPHQLEVMIQEADVQMLQLINDNAALIDGVQIVDPPAAPAPVVWVNRIRNGKEIDLLDSDDDQADLAQVMRDIVTIPDDTTTNNEEHEQLQISNAIALSLQDNSASNYGSPGITSS